LLPILEKFPKKVPSQYVLAGYVLCIADLLIAEGIKILPTQRSEKLKESLKLALLLKSMVQKVPFTTSRNLNSRQETDEMQDPDI